MSRKRVDIAEAAFRQLLDEGCTVLRLQRAARLGAQIYSAYFEAVDLSAPQFGTLAYLYRDGSHSVGTLAALTNADQTTLTRNLRLLEQRGLISLDVAADDRRRRDIRLTAEGRRLFQKALVLWQQAQADLIDRIGKSQATDLHRRLDDVMPRMTLDHGHDA